MSSTTFEILQRNVASRLLSSGLPPLSEGFSFALPSLLLLFFLRQTLWKPSLLPRGSPCSDKALALGLVRACFWEPFENILNDRIPKKISSSKKRIWEEKNQCIVKAYTKYTSRFMDLTRKHFDLDYKKKTNLDIFRFMLAGGFTRVRSYYALHL